ncbi:MAG TPA: hypothetical protein VKK31_20790 [Thermoanaerobaculia bacterium]|nr:hypothetical protein [Thermoanaerobaculia bacterium]
MSPALRVVLDTDFLSAFLKIDRLSLVKDFYGIEELLVPPAVYREVSLTDLLPGLVSIPWIRIQLLDAKRKQRLLQDGEFARLGPGEQEAIALSLGWQGAVLLMNDKQAGRVATRLDIEVLNIPIFLSACKISGFTSRDEIASLVSALEDRDHYGFRKDVRDLLLS